MKIKAPTLHKKATKAITRTHVATVAQHQLKETIKSTKENVGKMHEHLTISEDLIEIGIHTEISRNFEKFLSNPVEAFSEYTQGIISNWNVLVLKSATEFFTKRKKNISSVYYENMPNNICFYVILKVENIKNRSEIYNLFDNETIQKACLHISVYVKFVSELTESKLLSKDNKVYSKLAI